MVSEFDLILCPTAMILRFSQKAQMTLYFSSYPAVTFCKATKESKLLINLSC